MLVFLGFCCCAIPGRAAEKLENGLVAEFFNLGETVTEIPSISPRALPTFRRVDAQINYQLSSNAFTGTDLKEYFYVRWRGKIRIPATGEYIFSLNSDDGSRLAIDNSRVIDHGGLHSWEEKSGNVQLTAGDHDLEVELFQNRYHVGCELFWQSPTIPKQIVPPTALFHQNESSVNVERAFWFVAPEKLRQYVPRLWQSSDGLPHDAVQAVAQDDEGYLWIGTPQGLARFDGMRFALFNPQNTPALKGQNIRSLCRANDGGLWIGTEDSGLIRLQHGRFSAATFLTNAPVKVVLETRTVGLWIGTTNGVARYQNGKVSWLTKDDGLVDNYVLSLCEDHDGHIWIGTGAGLTRYDGKTLEPYNNKLWLGSDSVRALFCDRNNSLWIGSGGGGLRRFDQNGTAWFRTKEGVPDTFITAICEDANGDLWVGTRGGLCRRIGDKFVTEPNAEGTSHGAVFCLALDREGCTWLGTKEGLTQLRFKPFRSYTTQQGLGHNNVMSVCEDAGGTIWVMTWGGGLSGLKEGRITSYHRDNSALYDLLLAGRPSRDGSLWLGSDFDGGLFQFKDGTFSSFGKPEGIVDPAIRLIYEDRQTNLWLATSRQLYVKRGATFHAIPGSAEIGKTFAFTEDDQGHLWIGSDTGLRKIAPSKLLTPTASTETRLQDVVLKTYTTRDGLSSDRIRALCLDREHNLWIGTEGGGLNRFRNETFTAYTAKAGLFNDSISEILEDDNGGLWMSCFSGVFRVSKKDLDRFDAGTLRTLPCASFGKADGMSSAQCNGVARPAAWKAQDGRLWFATTRGVTVIDPASLNSNNSPPPVVIEHILANKQPLALDRTATPTAGLLEIQPGRGELELQYTALSFRAAEKNRFKYKLEGIDSDWVDAGARRVAFYNNVPAGDYTFRVIACNNDGLWNETGTTIGLRLLPHFWQTKWFLIVASVLAIASVAGLARYLTWRRLRRNLARLEQQHVVEKERTRIARDMHDDLGARLTEILMLSNLTATGRGGEREMKTNAGKVVDATEDLVRNLDGIVWAVSPDNDSLDNLALYFYEYAQRFFAPTKIRYRWQVSPPDLPRLPLSAEMRHNLFLVFKEALNNVAKHSGATEVNLSLSFEAEMLSLSIADNGKGFSESPDHFGNGLQNMRKRIERYGGTFTLKSTSTQGTCVRVVIGTRPSS